MDDTLCRFYAAIGKQDPSKTPCYSKSSYINIRAGLNRYLRAPPLSRNLNIMTDRAFMKSNQVFVGIIKKLRREGKDTSTHKPAITPSDMHKLYETGTLSNNNPWSLVHKVFFEISLYFCRRGCEGLRELTKNSFKICTNDQGMEYATMAYHETEKKKQGHEKDQVEKTNRMYAENNENCPVKSLKLLFEKLHPDCDAVFQYPNTNYRQTVQWYIHSCNIYL